MRDHIRVALAGPFAAAFLTITAAATLLIIPVDAFGQPTTTTTTLPLPTAECIIDMQGADDEPGQKDLTEFCKEPAGVSDPYELHVSWNFDNVAWTGNNTGDACVLFDNDGNGFADYALCVTVENGPPATQLGESPRFYSCGDDRPDRCTNGVEDTDGFSSLCMVNNPGQDTDPFATDPDHLAGGSCAGTDCTTEDAFVTCWIETDDVPGDESCMANSCTNIPAKFCLEDSDCIPITDVCSYPSSQPNSDPSDCIITPTAQDPCKNVDCSHLDSDCATGVCQQSDGSCVADPLAAGTACGDPSSGICDSADTCDGAGSCQDNNEPGTTECRADAGECDVPEYCDGAGSCPADSFEASGTACGDPSSGICDSADTCDGAGSCQDNNEPGTTVCRADAGECDVPEFCDGAGSCPADSFESSGTACGDPSSGICDAADTCDGAGSCQNNNEPGTTECRADAGECDMPEYCDGAGSCPADSFEPSGTACGDPSSGICDSADTCDGSGSCQNNNEPGTTECRADAGECDVPEYCDGAGSCPADSFESSGTACGDPSSGICDGADTCDGSGSCQDNNEPGTTECRADAGECDVPEFCDGSGSCPADSFEASGTACGDPSSGICDSADTCDGSGSCQNNNEPGTTECRADAGECDVPEFCDGSGSCPADSFEASGTACGDSSTGICDAADTCDGSGSCQDNNQPGTTECRADAGECDVPEFCDGAGSCPVDSFEPGGTACGDPSSGICDSADTCDGAGSCQDNNEPGTTECRADAGECDVPEFCDGSGSCPADSFESSGTACGDPSSGICDAADTCDGSGSCQDNNEPGTTECRADEGECDVPEFCDGSGSCPADSFEASGTACGDPSSGICDGADTCDGSGSCQDNNEPGTTECRADEGECDLPEYCDGAGSCPADSFEPSGTACGDSSSGICDNPDSCDGAGECLPNFEEGTTICRPDVGDCDVAETCNGAGICPGDNFERDGTPCDDGEVCTDRDICMVGNCEGTPIQPTLTVVKEVINEIRGTLESDDFRFILDDGTTQTEFRVEPDTIDLTVGSITFDIDHGVSYEVTELLGELADYYEVSYGDECDDTATCLDPAKFCVVTNDDIYRNQSSISFRSLTIDFVDEDEDRQHLEGEFRITDESESGDQPDGWIVLLDDYAMDWEHRDMDDTDWEPSYRAGQDDGALMIDGVLNEYVCMYEVIDVDGSLPALEGYESGDPVSFDEEITISYVCWFDAPLPEDGTLRGIASTGIFAKSGHHFLIRRTFGLDGSGMSPPEPAPEPIPEPEPEPMPEPEPEPEPMPEPTPPPWTCDDPSADGISSASDALYILRAALGMHGPDGTPPHCPHEFCDQNCDGEITATDALVSLRRGLGLLKKAGQLCCE